MDPLLLAAAYEQERLKQNQQAQPEPDSLLDTLGKVSLGAGILAGGLYGARRFFAGPKLSSPPKSAVPPSVEATVRRAASVPQEVVRRQQVDEFTRQARSERVPGVRTADLSRTQQVTTAPEVSSRNTPGTFLEFSQKASTFSPLAYLKDKGALAPDDLTSLQQKSSPVQQYQFANAVESGEDQMTGRVKQQLQRNEDNDLSQIEILENAAEYDRQAMIEEADPSQMIGYEADASINAAASSLPDGLPVDQAEGIAKTSAQRFLQRERDEIASQLGEQNLPITPSRIEQELANRLTKSSYKYGPKYSARRQGLELYAQTGDPVLLERIQRFGLAPASFETFETMPAEKRIGFENAPPFSTAYYPSEELSSTGLSSDITINLPTRGQTSLAEFRKPVITEDTAQRAEEFYQDRKGKALDWLGNFRLKHEPKRNQILNERRLIVEQAARDLQPQLEAARQSGNQEMIADLEQNLNVLRNVWKNPRLGSHREGELRLLDAQIAGAQNKIAEDIAGIQKKYPTTIADWSGESARIFGELDTETGELIPESIELRGDRPSILQQPKGGGGRNIAEYTAGERIDEEIRAIQGGGRIRDYDLETGAAAQHWLGDNTQTGREIDAYGIRLSGEKRADPTKQPSEPQYTKQQIIDQAMSMSQADPYGDVPVVPEYADVIKSLVYQEPTPEAKRSVLMSEAIRKAALQREQRNPRGGVIPDELTTLRRQMAQLDEQPVEKATGRLRRVPGTSIPPQQLTLPGVTGYKSRQTVSPADVAAEQLESYMSKLQRGRSMPLTSAVRIQPSLF